MSNRCPWINPQQGSPKIPTRATSLENIAQPDPLLPDVFARWFAGRGWTPRAHQLDCWRAARAGRSVLLIAPTGAGKTLAGFLPTLVELHERGAKPQQAGLDRQGIRRSAGSAHALHLAAEGARGRHRAQPRNAGRRDGPADPHRDPHRRHAGVEAPAPAPRPARHPADHAGAARAAARLAPTRRICSAALSRVVLDELHSLVTSKRGDLLSLGLARLFRLAPGLHDRRPVRHRRRAGRPAAAISCRSREQGARWPISSSPKAAPSRTSPCSTPRRTSALGRAFRAPRLSRRSTTLIKRHKTTLVFVNTRSQAEMIFQELWRINDDGLADRAASRLARCRAAPQGRGRDGGGSLRAVVCTSSLDLGIDWGDIDLVINVGAPKGSSRLLQRIGRANHRLDEPSRGILVPANRFEVLECRAAIDAVADECAGHAAAAHRRARCAGAACARHAPAASRSMPTSSIDEVRTAAPYAELTRARFRRRGRFRRHRRLRAEGL